MKDSSDSGAQDLHPPPSQGNEDSEFLPAAEDLHPPPFHPPRSQGNEDSEGSEYLNELADFLELELGVVPEMKDSSDSDSGAQDLDTPPSQGNEDSAFVNDLATFHTQTQVTAPVTFQTLRAAVLNELAAFQTQLTAAVRAAVLDLLRVERKVFKDQVSAILSQEVNQQILAWREEYRIKEESELVARLFQLIGQIGRRKKPEEDEGDEVEEEEEDSQPREEEHDLKLDVIAAVKAAAVDLLAKEMKVLKDQVGAVLRQEANQHFNALREQFKASVCKVEEEPKPSLMDHFCVDPRPSDGDFCGTPVVDYHVVAISKMLQSCSVPLGESIGNLLHRGIKQWAPKLRTNTALVEFSSPETAGDMRLLHFEAAIMGESIARMLQFSDVEVLRSTHVIACGSQGWEPICSSVWKPMQDDTLEDLRNMYALAGVQWQDEDGTFYSYKEEVQKKLQEKLDDWRSILPSGVVLTELISLRYRIDIQKAEWLIYVTPPEHKDHFNTVFKWAKHACWLADDNGYPKASHISAEKLSDTSRALEFSNLIQEAKKQSKNLSVLIRTPQTVDAVAYASLKYAVLNNTFDGVDFTHMFLHKGNNAVYLLRTYSWIQNWIRVWTERFALNMEELRVNYAVTLEYGGERNLGVLLVRFPEVIQEAIDCLSTGILCKYLYNLAVIFNEFFAEFVSWIPAMPVGAAKRKYLLFEATRIVMSKCFELLGIEPDSNLLF